MKLRIIISLEMIGEGFVLSNFTSNLELVPDRIRPCFPFSLLKSSPGT